jgi:hypothetical protein
MAAVLVWWVTSVLEAVILVRIFKNGVITEYAYFAVYLSCVFLKRASGYIIYEVSQPVYRYWYWAWEFVCVLAGYRVVLEVLENAFAWHSGPRKLARNVALMIFASVVVLTALQWGAERGSQLISTSVDVERNLRTAELVLLGLIIGVIFYYSIPVGRNLKGILLGYGLVVAIVVMDNALRSYVGPGFQAVFSSIRSYSYLSALVIWVSALWSYSPNPVPERTTALTADYEALASWTRGVLSGMREYLRKAARS